MNIIFMSMDTLPSTLWARDLYDQMHIRSDFRKWFPRMCQYGFIEGRDYEYMPRVRLQDEGGRTVQRYVKDYRITQDMAKKLCKLHHTAVSAAYHPQPFDWDVLLGLLHKKPPRRSRRSPAGAPRRRRAPAPWRFSSGGRPPRWGRAPAPPAGQWP